MNQKRVPSGRKAELLETARELFFRDGYENVSVQQLIESAGIAKGTLYYHFESKDELLEGVVEGISAELFEKLGPIIEDDTATAVEKFSRVFGLSNAWKRDNHQQVLAVYRMLYNPENLQLRVRLQAKQQALLESFLESIITEGIESGTMHCAHAAESAQAVVAILAKFSDRIVQLIENTDDQAEFNAKLSGFIRGTENVVERVLGVPPRHVMLADVDDLSHWYGALRDDA